MEEYRVYVLTFFKLMYLHISNICINLVEQLRDITNLEVAHDTDKVH